MLDYFMVSQEQKYEVTVLYYEDGSVRSMRWEQGGVLSRLCGPAIQLFGRDGRMLRQDWYLNGKSNRHYQEGPAVVILDPTSGTVRHAAYLSEGAFHREGGPAIQWFDKDGRCTQASWHLNGKEHRHYNDGPASWIMDPTTGIVVSESYLWEGEYHRIGGPADIVRHRKSGEIVRSSFAIHGKRYRPSPIDRRRMLGLSPS
jgi:hypothetical protein